MQISNDQETTPTNRKRNTLFAHFSRQNILILVAVMIGALVIRLSSDLGTAVAAGGPQTVPPTTLQSDGQPLPRIISVNGTGMASAQPDVAEIQLGVETVNTNASEAIDGNTERMTAVLNILKQMEVEDKDIQTTNYNIWIEQVTDKQGQPTGEMRYHVVNQIQVKLHDLTKTGELLQQTLKAGANTVGGISFSVANPTALQQEARDQAIADAQAKAEQLAAGLNAKLGPVHQVSEFGGVITPSSAPVAVERAAAVGGGGPVPVSGGEFSVTVQIQVIFDLVQ